MDPQTIRELDNGFTELNTAVRQTDQTFLDVLGPMAAQIKEKLSKENNQATASQNNITNQLASSYSKSKDLASKQQTLYQQQLQRRGYDIDQSGKEIKTSTDLSISQQQLLEKLDKSISKENALIQATNNPVKAFRDLGASLNSIEGIWDKLQDKMFEMTGKSVIGAAALQGTIGALTGIAKATGAMAEAIYQGERGASVGAKGAKEFNDSVSKAATGIGAALVMMPGSFLIKAFGAALVLVSVLLEKSTKLIEMGATFNDQLYKSYNTLSEKGLSTAQGMTGLKESLHRVGLTGGEIDKFNKLLGDNSKNLALFGGTAATGMAKYEKIANAIATPSSKINKEFLIMGINSDAQREHIMKYMTEEDRLGLAKGMSDEKQIAGARKYIDNLDKLSMLTGTNRKELEEARATVMANENLRAAIFEAEQDKTEEGKARLAELKRAYEAAAMLQATGDTKGATGVAEYFAGRGITGQASAVAYNQFSGKGGLIEGIKKGASSAELTTRAASGYDRQASMMADTGRFGGDTTGLMTGGFAQAQQFKTRSDELKKKAREKGYGDDVTAYIDAEQEAKKNTKDKTTIKNAEVAQLQQQTATILDNTAFAMMKTADLVMGPAMKLFGEATALFGDAVKKIAKDKGIEVPLTKEEQTAALKTEIAKLKESARIKKQSLDTSGPMLNNKVREKLQADIETINDDLANAEKKMAIIVEEKKAEPAKVPPGATIPTPPGPPAQGEGSKPANLPPGAPAKGSPNTSTQIASLEAQITKYSKHPETNARILKRLNEEKQVLLKQASQPAKGSTSSPANLPPGATIPTPPSPTAQSAPAQSEGGAPDTRPVKAKAPSEGKPKLTQVSSKSGKSTAVNTEFASPFQGIIDYLDGVGYKIYSLGGYVDRDVRGKPGVKSIHAHGAAIDINPTENPLGSQLITDMPTNISQVAAGLGLGWGGNWKSVKDAMHFSAATGEGGKLLKAKTGAMFTGPSEGYFVQLHGKEFVGNEEQLDAIKKLLDVVEENELISDNTETESVDQSSDDEDTTIIIEKFTEMLENKTDELLDKIKFGNRVDTDLLNYSQG